ncbi:astacin-like [Anopheles bellator]|uniref:astacin-like n=1 Tax=Anopheles bellator TaxID=139047 RepID=UPI00264918AB|nr:astacin-like [Anopheles bellator]
MFSTQLKLAAVILALGLVELGLAVDLSNYTKPSVEVGKRLKNFKPKGHDEYMGYAHEYGFGHYYEGDILLQPTGTGRVALGEQFVMKKWPAAVVPYVIKADFTPSELRTLQAAFDQYHEKTCVRFVPRTTELFYVTITNRDEGCYSYVGRNPSNQYNNINLQTPECMEHVGTPVHEMMHALGFFHEFTRPDRDEYVKLHVENLRPEYQSANFIAVNFGKLDPAQVTSYGVPYNYASVMHYSRFAGSVGLCCPVFTNIKPYFGDFGSEAGLTPLDTKQVVARYCKK